MRGKDAHKQLARMSLNRPSESVRKILGNNAEFPGGHIMLQERSYYAANYVNFLEISHRTRTVIRFTTTLKISEALHDVSNAK